MAKNTKEKQRTIGYAAFKVSLADGVPPKGLAPAVAALWYAANGLWERAHEVAQKRDYAAGAWVHAYLHRIEGDEDNARYWYGRVGKPVASVSHDKEWEAIAKTLLS